ncbi:hypothetical protein HNV08_13685 [Winogradskyella eckloniae]|uniref:hypothetical protein n=1 Tax=Winogradskyella eckloniae TaxID=1089306 RepID=UPI00156659CE|nr:hypothetical protein [Winogradskyella eckloniae]NRD21104.1 hypothetical protein [Winogradskyella eckloniae]
MSFFRLHILNKNWQNIILWWELRRIPYNLILLLILFISFKTIEALPQDGFITLIPGPALLLGTYLSLLLYFIIANICYTFGWILHLVFRHLNNSFIHVISSYLFGIGILISIIVTLSPILIWMINLALKQFI